MWVVFSVESIFLKRRKKNIDKFCVYDWSIYEMIFVHIPFNGHTSAKSAQPANVLKCQQQKQLLICVYVELASSRCFNDVSMGVEAMTLAYFSSSSFFFFLQHPLVYLFVFTLYTLSLPLSISFCTFFFHFSNGDFFFLLSSLFVYTT